MFNWKRDKISAKLTDTFIGEGTIVEGTIRSAGGVRLEGQLRGDISCDGDVVVGESGFAVSNITAHNVILAGQVTGNVHITGKMTISSTGKLYGDMTAAAFTIEDGGLFQGKSTMDQDEPAVNPADRRTGIERRSGNSGSYTGVERRSGYDRRDMVVGEDGAVVWAAPKKISYRAIEKPSETDETSVGSEGSEAEGKAGDPLRESGKAFISSISGGGKPVSAAAGAALSADLAGSVAEQAELVARRDNERVERDASIGNDRAKRDASKDSDWAERDAGKVSDRAERDASKDKEAFNQVVNRINQGINEAERAALSGVIWPEAVVSNSNAAASQYHNETAAGSEFVSEHSELMDEHMVSAVDLVLDTGSFESDSVDVGRSSVGEARTESFGGDVASAGSFEGVVASTGNFEGDVTSVGSFEGVEASAGSFERVEVSSGSFEGVEVSAGSFEGVEASLRSFEVSEIRVEDSVHASVEQDVVGTVAGMDKVVVQAEAVVETLEDEEVSVVPSSVDSPEKNVINAPEPLNSGENVYSYGFEELANGKVSTNEPAQSEKETFQNQSNARSAAEAAALLKNW
ncbi:polymer-forming cytoskeletal protein [Paenibacillus sp. CF384]|uniref:bactofilin family protein n=1 Tax=Paenibacillus sp. CF384 TaxID=1884382 RepID=UPI00089933BC|nr:polymer-forming cytoskeletal protein [Paenibacillus sp. CF384]SDW69934.1 protein CcmA, bactofilin family [Paenibacillus sp. CF384]